MTRHAGRRLAGAGALALGLALAMATPATADDPTGAWTDPAQQTVSVEPVPVGYVVAAQPLRGTARHSAGIDAVTFVLVEDASPPGTPCSAATDTRSQVHPGQGANQVSFSFDATFPCNRRYLVRASVQPRRPLGHAASSSVALDLRVVVAIPPPDVSELTAEVASGARSAVQLEWAGISPQPADFGGYEVSRASGDGELERLATVDPSTTSWLDTEIVAGRSYRYAVVGLRPGPEPGTAVFSSNPAEVATEIPMPTTTTTAARGGGTSSPSGGQKAKPSPGGGRSPTTVIVQFQPPPVPTTVDTGFNGVLPFEVPPTTGLAGGPFDDSAIARLDDEGDADRQTLALVAAGLATLVGAGVLRFVTAAAKR